MGKVMVGACVVRVFGLKGKNLGSWSGSCDLNLDWHQFIVGLAYYQGKDIIVFRFIIEYSSLRDFGP
jgi:hypothetical protein